MNKQMLKVVPLLLAAGFLATCASGGQQTWYEERCSRTGLKQGSADFDQCVSRDKQWIEDTQRRAARQNHP